MAHPTWRSTAPRAASRHRRCGSRSRSGSRASSSWPSESTAPTCRRSERLLRSRVARVSRRFHAPDPNEAGVLCAHTGL